MSILMKCVPAFAVAALLAAGTLRAQERPRTPEAGTQMSPRPGDGGTKRQPRAVDPQAAGAESGATERERRAQERSQRATRGICSGC